MTIEKDLWSPAKVGGKKKKRERYFRSLENGD